MPDIEVSDLSVNYKTSHGDIHALENIEFQLEDGESIGIAGESACGKSTLGLTIIRMPVSYTHLTLPTNREV